jgi:NitT/TauT family transport system substrate-binding protein
MSALPQNSGTFRRVRLRLGRVLAMPLVLAALLWLGSSIAHAADTLRIAAQKTGTLAWELEIVRAHGLDRQADLNLDVTELASTEAGQIALKGGSADLILSDWLWVARERALGDDLVFYPYSSTLGAVMVPDGSPIKELSDLKGKRLGVAGGPLDKSWLLLQALAQRSGLDLKTQAAISYGAPPLLSAMLLQGKTDATLTFWNFCARLEAGGMRRAIDMADVMKWLGTAGPVPMIGYVFHGGWAERHRALLDRFFSVTQQAKKILAGSPAEWQRLGPRIGASDQAELDVYRRRYAEGLPTRPLADEIADAQALYKVLAHIGGPDLVGPAQQLAPGTFYTTGPSE